MIEMSAEECRTAFQAALELIEDKCGISFETAGKMVKLEEIGTTVKVPKEVEEITFSNPELTRAEKVESVAKTSWAQGWGRGMCALVSPELVGAEREECIDRMARKLAERVV